MYIYVLQLTCLYSELSLDNVLSELVFSRAITQEINYGDTVLHRSMHYIHMYMYMCDHTIDHQLRNCFLKTCAERGRGSSGNRMPKRNWIRTNMLDQFITRTCVEGRFALTVPATTPSLLKKSRGESRLACSTSSENRLD